MCLFPKRRERRVRAADELLPGITGGKEICMTFLSHLINGISLGSVYAIIALGYTMVYGIAKMLNFAHGDVIMVGAYISFCTTSYLGLSPLISVIFAVIVCTVLGIAIERMAYKPLRQAPSLAVLITAIGVSYFLQNAALLIWGSSPKTFSSIVGNWSVQLFGGRLIISGVTIVTVAACILIMIVLAVPGIILAAAASTLLPWGTAAALLATLVWNLLLSAAIVFFCRDVLLYVELNNR